ncbi:hypothetical protein HG536_0A06990 [Torulaspora globosa]|uniref:Uncharacterized protein n=1 Tax=Torulaspora globosa TaxID=48254 RepID=A0A7G3ZBJ8_9SACH|nr:uncharacterized protein HG536_0A06990 [Torulaspora globosa]QLL30884.1 hypothetical protein HG536_0A06990 [Torulaspora globosa]
MKFGKTFPNHQVPEWSHQYVNYKSLKKLIKQINREQEKLYRQTVGDGRSVAPPAKARDSGNQHENYLDNAEVKKLLASFFFALDRDIEKVDNFYNMQYLEYERRLRRLTSSAQFTDVSNAILEQSGMSLLPGFQPSNESKDASQDQNGHSSESHSRRIMSPGPHDVADSLEEVLGMLLELRSHFRNLKWYGELNKRAFIKILKKLDKKVGTNQQHAYLQARILPLGFSNDAEVSRNLSTINEFLDKVSLKVRCDNANEASYVEQQRSDSDLALNRGKASSSAIQKLIEEDNGTALIQELTKAYRSIVLVPTRVLVNLLNKASLYQSFKCVDELLEIIPSLRDPTDINVRNFFHHHVIALGKNHKRIRELGASESNGKDGHVLDAVESKTTTDEKHYTSLSFEAAAPPYYSSKLIGAFGPDGVNSNDSPSALLYILGKLPAHLRPCLVQRDNYKRTPLHYSCQYGLVEVTKIIIESLKEWGAWNPDISIDDDVAWGDTESLTPLHLAVLGPHPLTAATLLSYTNPSKPVSSPQLIHLATRLNSSALIKALLSAKGFDVNYCDEETQETPLYMAAKLNLYEAAACLLENGANTELTEKLFGWSPIFVAAAEGFERMVKLLVDHGANYVAFDESGWTPMEHAALRGHLDIAKMIKITGHPEITNPRVSQNDQILVAETSEAATSGSNSLASESNLTHSESQASLEHISSTNSGAFDQQKFFKSSITGGSLHNRPHANILPQPVKSFGHRYLVDNESVILITLGGNDTRKTSPAVTLNKVPVSKVSSTELDTALSLVISCDGDLNDTPIVLDLPLDANLDHITFKVPFKRDSPQVVYFDVVPTYGSISVKEEETANRGNFRTDPYSIYDVVNRSQSSLSSTTSLGRTNKYPKVIGRAVGLLNKTGASVGINRRSLNDEMTLPIIANESLEILGTVTFEYMTVSPFHHPKMSLGRTETYWKSLVTTRVIGHRGLGKNFSSKKSLQLGENTVESFIAAASLGASYVEFDVQMTKDNIPVVYHDFLVAETGVDIPMHELTLEQFLHLNKVDSQRGDQRRHSVDDSGIFGKSVGDRLNKNGNYSNISELFENRMKLTKTFKEKNFKGNARGHSIAAPFVTLEELFKKIPANVGFNIECKYPMVDEAEQEDIGQIAVEMNHWVDTVLQVVYDNANGRDIMFSSFHPDICVMLSLKQPSIPILFLTQGGTYKMADVRASSLQNAIRFARSWNLLGIVSDANPIIEAPRLVQVVKSSGLVFVTYGVENNDPANANIEMDAGVDAVIVDNVLAVRKGLTKEALNAK